MPSFAHCMLIVFFMSSRIEHFSGRIAVHKFPPSYYIMGVSLAIAQNEKKMNRILKN